MTWMLLLAVFSAHAMAGGTAASAEPTRLSPVWSMGVAEGRAVVRHNELDDRGLRFPLPVVRLYEPPRVATVPVSPRGVATPDVQYAEDSTGVLFAANQSFVLSRGEAAMRIPHRGYEAAFASVARVGAVCAFHFPNGRTEPDPRGDPGSLVIFDLDGNTLQEVAFEPGHGLSQLYVSNDGTWVMATERGEASTIAADRVLWIDVASGRREYLPGLAGGVRDHSGDGLSMTVVQGGWGKIMLFALDVPSRPVKVSEFDGGLVAAAAINHDGSLVAAALPHADQKVVVLDRRMTVVGVAERHPESSYGLTIVGDFLFVGFQTNERPRWGALVTSAHIDLFDMGALGRH